MQEVKVNINNEQIEFLNEHHSYGFKDKSSFVRRAIDYFKKELEAKKLLKSADLYKEIYEKDNDLKELTNSAISSWHHTILKFEEALKNLISSPSLSFDNNLHKNLPKDHGIYRIYNSDEPEKTFRAGRTKKGRGGLKQRIYNNHYQGNQKGNIRSQLVKSDNVTDMLEAKKFLEKNCKIQILIIRDDFERKWIEYFMLSILQPIFCD